MTFEQLIENAPSIILRRLEQLKFLRERPDYHPEPSTYEHIKIVTERLIQTGDKDLIMSGVLHDICKFDTVRMNPKTGWPTSPGHDKAAARLIEESHHICLWIEEFGADPNIVMDICEGHMIYNILGEMREGKRARKIEEWEGKGIWVKMQLMGAADDMLTEFNLEEIKKRINYEESSNH